MKRRTRVSAAVTIVTLSILATATATATATAASADAWVSTQPAAAAPPSVLWSAPDEENGTPTVKRLPEERADLRDLAPGDQTQWAAEVTNTGEPGTLGVEFVAHGENSLMSRKGDGLRMIVDVCSRPLIASVTPRGATIFSCTSEQRRLGTVSSATGQRLTARDIIETGETVGVRVVISFPVTADNSFENASAAMDIVYTITPPGESEASAVPAAPAQAEVVRTVFPGILATGISVMFMSFAAAVIISLGILLLSLVPRGTRERGDEDS